MAPRLARIPQDAAGLRGIVHRGRGARMLCDLSASDSAPGLM